MQQAFGTVLWVVCGVAAVVAAVMLARSGKALEEFRNRGMVMDRDAPRGPAPGSAAAEAERDAEIREMLHARNRRRIRRGEAPVDVEVELARLTGNATGRFAAGRDVSPKAKLAPAAEPPQTPNAGMDAGTPPAGGTDPALREEIRQMVQARNYRRARAGKPPLDVEAEIARELKDLLR